MYKSTNVFDIIKAIVKGDGMGMKSREEWYKLDNAAKVFPAASSSENTSTFRVAFTLKDKIKPDVLQKALDRSISRYPTLAVRLRRGLFWYYFEKNEQRLIVQEEKDWPCYRIDKYANNKYLIKVLYYDKRISVEVFHSLTDGKGAIEFLKTLVYEYLLLLGYDIDDENLILMAGNFPSKYEMEDSFQRYYKPCSTGKEKDEKAFQLEGELFEFFGNNVVHGMINSNEIKKIAKRYGVTITEYIVALMIFSIHNGNMKYGINEETISISVPVNLRGIFPSVTLRNFFSVVNVGMKLPQEPNLDDIIDEVSSQLKKKTQKENLYPRIAENIKFEKLLIARFIPLWFKNMVLKYVYYKTNSSKTTSVTNLGRIIVPKDVEKHIEKVDAILYSSAKSPMNCAVCSIGEKLSITFSRTIKSPAIIKEFFNYLSREENLEVNLFTNKWGIEDEIL